MEHLIEAIDGTNAGSHKLIGAESFIIGEFVYVE